MYARIPEIGIRKAFGASKTDIVFQFMFEMVVIAFIVSIFAVCSSYLCCKLAEEYLARNLFLSFKVQVSNAQLILPLLVGVTEAVTCSFIPSLYAASIKVTDSLKFE
ncbi:MAG: ABC transporter permease [Clostridiaceae bacterium]|nr:ABC transporter permease [Clostridiaceae bacterium]